MPDDRPAEDVVTAIARLSKELEDLKTTYAVRSIRRPTGDIEPTFRPTPKTDALFLQGQTLSRTTYAALFQWANGLGLVGAGNVFGVGDSSTTFTLPNFQGRVPVGVGTLASGGATDTYAVGGLAGVARVGLTVGELAAHAHSGGTNVYGHDHGWAGDHGHGLPVKHNGSDLHAHNAAGGLVSEAANNYLQGAGAGTGGGGNHLHGWSEHSHAFTTNNTGSGTGHENRPPMLAVNWMIWT